MRRQLECEPNKVERTLGELVVSAKLSLYQSHLSPFSRSSYWTFFLLLRVWAVVKGEVESFHLRVRSNVSLVDSGGWTRFGEKGVKQAI